MPGRRRVSVQVREEVRKLTREGHGPTAIYHHLNKVNWFGSYSVSDRTIQRLAKEFNPPDDSGSWSITGMDPDDFQLIRDVLAERIGSAVGRRWPTTGLVDWIVHVRRADPEIPAAWASALANAYRVQGARKEDTRYLDMVLLFRPWKSENALNSFIHAVQCSRPLLGSPDALRWVLADVEALNTCEVEGELMIDDDVLSEPCNARALIIPPN